MPPLDRRTAIKYGATFCLGALAGPWLWSRLEPETVPAPPPLRGFGRMQQNALLARLERLEATRAERFERIRTASDVLDHQRELRDRIRRCFGPWPPRRPVRSRVLSVATGSGYRVESIRFASRSGLEIAADLYLPDLTSRRPAVLGACGHAAEGKDFGAYRDFAVALARRGFVVLLYDPIGQGERVQFPDEEGRSRLGPTTEHLVLARAQILVGESFATWRVIDAMSGLDLLEEHPAVDPTHLGVTGNSGGGTITTWLAALDPRVTMVAPSCSVGSFVTNAVNELVVDPEQCPPHALAWALDHEDFLAVFAPRPTTILATEGDFFDVRRTRSVYEHLARLHALLGSADSVSLHVDRGPHGLTARNREAMVAAFAAVADPGPVRTTGSQTPHSVPPRAPVAGPSLPELTRAAAERLVLARPPLDPAGVADSVRNLARIDAEVRHSGSRILRGRSDRGHPRSYTSRFAVDTEPGIVAVVYALNDPPEESGSLRPAERTILYVAHHSADEELRNDAWLRATIDRAGEASILAVDLRGIGESRPTTGDDLPFDAEYGSDYFHASYGLMLDEPSVGRRTSDLLAVIDWIRASGPTRIELAARGWGTIPATLATVLDHGIDTLRLFRPLHSWEAVATSPESVWPLSVMIPGVLAHFDLPQLRTAIGERLAEVTDPCGPMDRP